MEIQKNKRININDKKHHLELETNMEVTEYAVTWQIVSSIWILIWLKAFMSPVVNKKITIWEHKIMKMYF